MQISWKGMVGLLVGAVILGSVASVAAQEEPPATGTPPETEPDRNVERGHFKFKMGKHAVRSDAVVADPESDGFLNVRTDRGTLTAVNGSTLVIEEADGTTVNIPVGEDTTIRRDRDEAELSDLQPGDHVSTVRVGPVGGDLATKAVKAISAERYAQMQAQREACQANPDECPRKGHGRRGFGPGRLGVTPDAGDASPSVDIDAA